jgi:hypothetical protein
MNYLAYEERRAIFGVAEIDIGNPLVLGRSVDAIDPIDVATRTGRWCSTD